jgi:hypothetical protein
MLRSIRRQRAVVFIGVLALTAAGIELFAADAWTWLDVAADEPIDHAVMIRGPYEDAHRKTRLRGPVAVVTADGDAGPCFAKRPCLSVLHDAHGLARHRAGWPRHDVPPAAPRSKHVYRPVTVNLGTLATTGTAAALAGATSIAVNAGGALLLGQTNGVNDSAAVTLSGGGDLFTGTSVSETFGALNLAGGGWSIINFLGNSSTLNFSSLSIGGLLAILNYTGADDFLNIASGTATGSLSQIAFYSDSGSTLLGYGGFEGTRLVPVAVPEPSTRAMALAGLACGCWMLRRQKPAGGPRLSSLS